MQRWWDSVSKLKPGWLAFLYVVLGGGWVAGAYALVSFRAGATPTHATLTLVLGLSFVLATGFILYALVRRGSVSVGESDRLLTTLMRNLPGMVYRGRNDPDGTMLFVSEGCRQLTGYLPNELVNNERSSFGDLILPPDRERVTEEIRQAVRAGRPFELIYRIRTADGDEKWVWERGTGLGSGDDLVLEGFIADITDRRRAEQVNALLATAVEHAGEGIMVTDKTGTILYANPAFEGITGYSPAEVVGLNPRILKSGEHDEDFYQGIWDSLGRGDVWNSRLINRRKDGTLYEERQTISPVKDAAGETVNYVAIKRDVTDIVALEAQLRQSQKMEAVGKLAGGIAHDFNNLLMAIMGHSELLSIQLPAESSDRQDVEEIKKACLRAAALTRQLLMFSRRQTARPRLIDLNSVVSDMKSMLERLIGTDIELIVDLDDDIDLVRADASQIEQIIMNLTVNSRDAMTNGGTLKIETRNEDVDSGHPATGSGLAPGLYVRMSVRDTGSGIRKSIQDRIFEPFFSTKGEEEGTGLGLSTVYAIVEQSGGHINLYSEPGSGTIFDIYMPPVQVERDVESEKLAAVRLQKLRPPRGAETVILIEPQGPVRGHVEEMLERGGYIVLAADGPKDASTICQEYPGDISLMIAELGSPGGWSAQDLARNLTDIRPELRVLYLAGETDDRVAASGAAWLEKPFSPEILLQKIRTILESTPSDASQVEQRV